MYKKKYIRISPDFGSISSNIDTITVFSDALVAIDVRRDYYSAKTSLVIDSLILKATSQTLSKKGYQVKTVEPFLMGSFMDTILTVPFKSMNSDIINTTVLPCVFPNQLTCYQVKAVKNINRKLYQSLAFSKYIGDKSLPLTTEIKSDLQTISDLINGNYAMFIFHQAGLVNADLMSLLGIAQFALTGLATGGSYFAAVVKTNVFHTYIILIELSSGKIIWSNYRDYFVTPEKPMFQLAQGKGNNITDYIKPDSLSFILKKWSKSCFSHFPEKSSSKYFDGYSRPRYYPSQNFFFRTSSSKFFDINKKYKEKIDSLVTELSISNEIPKWDNTNTTLDTISKRFPLHVVEPKIDSLYNKYFKFAYNCRLKHKPLLEGKVRLSFTTNKSGNNSNISIDESTLDDIILEYVISFILKTFPLPNTNYRSKTAHVIHEIDLGRKKR